MIEVAAFPKNLRNNLALKEFQNQLCFLYVMKPRKKPIKVNVNGASKEDGAKLIIYKNNGGNNQKFKISKVKDNQYTIQSVHSGKWLKSNGTKGEK